MPFGSPSRPLGVLLGTVLVFLVALVLTPALIAAPMSPEVDTITALRVRVGDTVGPSGQQNSVITIKMDNLKDSVAAFTLFLKLDRKDIARFKHASQLVKDTTYWRCIVGSFPTCTDSVAVAKDSLWKYPGYVMHIKDTTVQVATVQRTGTITSGWDMISTRADDSGLTVLLTGIANTNYSSCGHAGQPPCTPPLAPQTGGVLLKLLADIMTVPDTLTDRTAKILVERNFLDKFTFSRPNGTAIGLKYVYVPDTACWHCLAWYNGHCQQWEEHSCPSDSSKPVIDTIPKLDTTRVKIYDGSIYVLSGCCKNNRGNVDGDALDKCNLVDLSSLINYLTGGPFRPPCMSEADVNADNKTNLVDLSSLINYLTGGAFRPAACP